MILQFRNFSKIGNFSCKIKVGYLFCVKKILPWGKTYTSIFFLDYGNHSLFRSNTCTTFSNTKRVAAPIIKQLRDVN